MVTKINFAQNIKTVPYCLISDFLILLTITCRKNRKKSTHYWGMSISST